VQRWLDLGACDATPTVTAIADGPEDDGSTVERLEWLPHVGLPVDLRALSRGRTFPVSPPHVGRKWTGTDRRPETSLTVSG
jgi:hypothetical protein